ncbi:ABC transporter permease [bacterium]|nr:ABC transporter permease [bacterium]
MSFFLQEIEQTFLTLKENKTRSFLTIIGIIVGVAAIIGIISIGQAGKNSIKKDLESFGKNIAAIWPEWRENSYYVPLNKYDLQFIRHLKYIKKASPVIYLNGNTQFKDYNSIYPLNGVDENFFGLNNKKVKTGRLFSKNDNIYNKRVCVITEGLEKELAKRFAIFNPVGKIIKINGFPFFIVGVLKPVKLSSFLASFQEKEKEIYIPEKTMATTFGKKTISYILFSTVDKAKPEVVKRNLLSLFKLRHGSKTLYKTQFLENQIDAFSNVMNKITLIITLIGALSLFVGGVGIMNIMFITVTERTREIGLRKAIGASEMTLMRQFLMEAIFLSIIGAFIGTLFGVAFTILIQLLIKWKIFISIFSVILAFFFSTIIGVVFGIIPAKKAASLNPIDALRYE